MQSNGPTNYQDNFIKAIDVFSHVYIKLCEIILTAWTNDVNKLSDFIGLKWAKRNKSLFEKGSLNLKKGVF